MSIFIPRDLLTKKEQNFIEKKKCILSSKEHEDLGTIYEFSDKVYDMFEKHIVVSDSSRSFALRALSKLLAIPSNTILDKGLFRAVVISCATSLYSYAPIEGDRLLRSSKV